MAYPDFLKSTGYGTGEGLHGYGCRHSFSAGWDFTPEPYTPEQLAKMTAQELETKEYEWKDRRGVSYKRSFTLRQALDRQNKLHVQMRKTLSTAHGMRAAEDREGYNEARSLYRRQLAEYKQFSKDMGIVERLENVYVAYPGGFHSWRNGWNK